jgi:hypothetical protein
MMSSPFSNATCDSAALSGWILEAGETRHFNALSEWLAKRNY